MHVPKAVLAAMVIVGVGCGTDAVVSTTSGFSVLVQTSGESVDTAFGLKVDFDTTTHALKAGVTTTFSVIEGTYTLELVGVADNCSVEGDNPRTVKVGADEVVPVSYHVPCTTNGSVKVTITTTGPDRDDMYTLAFDTDYRTVLVGPNQFVVVSLPVGTHSVALRDVAANCAVQGDNPVQVNVVAGETVSTGFAVSCVPR
jgi:hypothetical protein